MTSFESLPLPALTAAFVRLGSASLDIHDPSQEAYSDETQEIGKAILARSVEGHDALRGLLADASESVKLLAASWLLDVEPGAAAPLLEQLAREGTFANASFARLRLLKARNDGILPEK